MPQAGAQEHPIEGEDCTRHHTHSLFVADVSLAMDHEGADAAATESFAQFTSSTRSESTHNGTVILGPA